MDMQFVGNCSGRDRRSFQRQSFEISQDNRIDVLIILSASCTINYAVKTTKPPRFQGAIGTCESKSL